jgi:hypothetical protein
MGTKNPATIFDVQGGFVGINDPKILASKSVQIGLKIEVKHKVGNVEVISPPI